ncbi:NAD-dependent epimerase/dehydratase family protein [Veillonella sp. CHU740]|uniref:NAD-dependent epimerase/dehydratase family protein n=1 Tax=Veillonella sp. CHU740 TaxID=2490950 RepID=UPI000F8C6A94|nr:NAD-dependent epimerase/dehydratase family protein [Veillonella sp. CHU740]
MNICVTGGAGFIGSHLVDRLIKEGHRVQVIDNLSSGLREFVNPKAEFVELDIRDAKILDVFQDFQPDYVFHEAAQTVVGESMVNPTEDCDINLMGLLNLLQASVKVGVKKFLMPSSAAVYGDLETLPLTEELQGIPRSCYGLTKLTTEGYLRIYEESFGLPYICYRYANVYGPRQGNGGEGGVISIFCEQVVKGETLVVYGDGTQTRDFVYVDDVVEANILGLRDDVTGIINVSTGTGISLNDLMNTLEEITNTTINREYQEPRIGDIKHSLLSTEKASQVLGYAPTWSLRDGLENTYHYVKDNM